MKNLSRVVWSEGMYLSPHHFQAQARYFEDSVHFAVDTLWFEGWGVMGVEFDAEALRNGTVSLLRARGVFPDGLPFDIPESDNVRLARNIGKEFPATADSLLVYLAVPQRATGGANCELQPNGKPIGTRYVASEATLSDETTGQDEKKVSLGRKNFRLLLENESLEQDVTIPIARVRRGGAGMFVYDPRFIAPCLTIGASEPLMALLLRLIEKLEETGASLAPRGSGGRFRSALSADDVASFWFRHIINTSTSALRHLYHAKRGHPEELFREMSRLAGGLCTFSLGAHPRSLPAYDHRRLQESFEALDEHIRRHLDSIRPSSAITIPLKQARPLFWESDAVDPRCFGKSRWMLGVQARGMDADVIRNAGTLVKFCSAAFIGRLVESAVPGLPLSHVAVPPAAIAPRPEMHYFNIGRYDAKGEEHPCWKHIQMTNRVGIYVPGALASPELELVVVLEK